jgi:hypothetical protein
MAHHLASPLMVERIFDVPPRLTAARPAATDCGSMSHVSSGQRAATVLLPFTLRDGLFFGISLMQLI